MNGFDPNAPHPYIEPHYQDLKVSPVAAEPEKLTGQEVVQSLTGFDEIAIKKYFAMDIGQDMPVMTLSRALVFTLLRRQGMKDNDAHHKSMEITQKELATYFAEPEDDGFSEPGTAAGNG